MLIKFDEKNLSAEIEIDGDAMLWSKDGKTYLHVISCKEVVVRNETLYTEGTE